MNITKQADSRQPETHVFCIVRSVLTSTKSKSINSCTSRRHLTQVQGFQLSRKSIHQEKDHQLIP